jgi:hypothetical protein
MREIRTSGSTRGGALRSPPTLPARGAAWRRVKWLLDGVIIHTFLPDGTGRIRICKIIGG